MFIEGIRAGRFVMIQFRKGLKTSFEPMAISILVLWCIYKSSFAVMDLSWLLNVICLPFVDKPLSYIANDAPASTPVQVEATQSLDCSGFLVGAQSPSTIEYPTKLSSH